MDNKIAYIRAHCPIRRGWLGEGREGFGPSGSLTGQGESGLLSIIVANK